MKTRIASCLVALFFGANSANAANWNPILDTDLVDRADWIVVGRIVEQTQNSWRIEVDKMIQGEAVEEISIVPISPFKFYALDEPERPRIYGIETREGRNFVFHPACIREPEDEARLRLARAIFDRPADFLDEKRPEIAFALGRIFEKPETEEAHGLSRDRAVFYLKNCLKPAEHSLFVEAIRSLQSLEDWSAVPKICELIGGMTGDRDVGRGINSAITYLMKSEKPEAIERLEQLLAETAPAYPASHWLADPAAEALGKIGAPSSLQVIERAAVLGVQRAEEALAHLGTEESFELLLEAYLADEKPGSQPHSLFLLVCRSNRDFENWMYLTSYNWKTLVELKPRWKAWWEANRDGFEIVRSAEAGLERFQAAQKAGQPN